MIDEINALAHRDRRPARTAELPPRILAHGGAGARLPPLLRHQHAWSASGPRSLRVFEDTHALVLDWVRKGVLDGLRVDHPDGLRDPRRVLRAAATSTPPTAGSSSRRSSSPASELPDGLARRRHDRLRLPQPRQRPADRPRGGGAPDRLLHAVHRGLRRLPAMVRDKKHLVLQGALRQRPRPPDLAHDEHLRAPETVSRLHPARAERHAPRGDRLLPRLPDLHRGRGRDGSATSTAATSTRRSSRRS